MRKDLLVRYLNSSSSSLVRAQNILRESLTEEETNDSTTTRALSGTSGYSSDDLQMYRTLIENTEFNLKTLRVLIQSLKEEN